MSQSVQYKYGQSELLNMSRMDDHVAGLMDLNESFVSFVSHNASLFDAHVDEKAAIAAEVISPKQMRYRDIPDTLQTSLAALADDPLEIYLRDPAGQGRARRAAYRWALRLYWTRWVALRRAWTVHGGESVLVWLRAPNDPQGQLSPRERATAALLTAPLRALALLEPAHLRKRRAAADAQIGAAVDACLGAARLRDALELSSLGTHPARRGRGYASALVRVATNVADAQGRATWLASSNVENAAFYNALGFFTVGSVEVGRGDATWTGPPIQVDIMLREPKALGLKCLKE